MIRQPIYIYLLMMIALMLFSHRGYADAASQLLEQVFVTSLVLTDSDTISLGFVNFDPNTYLHSDNSDLGNTDAVSIKNHINTLSIPYSFDISMQEASPWSHRLGFRGTYFNSSLDSNPSGAETPDENSHSVYAFVTELTQRYSINNQWQMVFGEAAYLMRYKNHYDYNSVESESFLQPLDGLILNVSSNSWMLEPHIGLSFNKDQHWGSWHFNSDMYYAFGRTFGGDYVKTDTAKLEVWRYINSIDLHYPMSEFGGIAEVLYLKASRVDLGGGVTSQLETDHYYEFDIAYLFNTGELVSFIDNIGIGLSFNVGSVLRGGSIVIFFNE